MKTPSILLGILCLLLSVKSFSQCAISRTITALNSPSLCTVNYGDYVTEPGMSNYQWSVPDGATVVFGGAATDEYITIEWSMPGDYEISVNYTDTDGCIASSPAVKSIHVDGIAEISGSASGCVGPGNVYTATPGMNSYDWVVADGTITSGWGTHTITVTWPSAGTRGVVLNYTTPGGCTESSSLYVTAAIPTIHATTTLTCQDIPVTYTTQSGKSSYLWSLSPGGVITQGGTTSSNTVTVRWTGSGAQWISVNYSSGGCMASSATVLNTSVNEMPSMPVISGNHSVCANMSSGESADNLYSTLPGQSEYVWTIEGGYIQVGDDLITESSSIRVTWYNTSGVRSLGVRYRNAAGCQSPLSKIEGITILPSANPTISGNTLVCANTTHTYTTESGNTDYIWSIPSSATLAGGGTSADNWISVTWREPVALFEQLRVSYKNAAGCTGTSSIIPAQAIRVVNPSVIAFQSPQSNACAGSTQHYFISNTTASNLTWSVPTGGVIVSGGTPVWYANIRWEMPGTHTIMVTGTDAVCPPPAPAVHTVTVPALSTPLITGNATPCPGVEEVYTTQSGKTGYQWSIAGDGYFVDDVPAMPHSRRVVWRGGAGAIHVTYSENGCTGPQASLAVTVPAPEYLPFPGITGSTSTCAGSQETYSVAAGKSEYRWIYEGGILVAGGGPDDNTVTVQWPTAGDFSVRANYRGSSGCYSPYDAAIPVGVNTIPVPTLTGPDAACINTAGHVYRTEPGKSNYNWTINGGSATTSANTNEITVYWSQGGVRSISVSYNNGSCAPVTPASKQVTIHTPVVPVITGPNSVCIGSAGNTYTTEGGMSSYQWTIPEGGAITGGGSAGDSAVTVTWNTLERKIISVKYVDANGCSSRSADMYTYVVPIPVPTLSGNPNGCFGTLNGYSTESGRSNYNWTVSPGGTVVSGGTSSSSSVFVIWNAASNQSISVTYSKDGCAAQTPATKEIPILPVVVPTITGPDEKCRDGQGVDFSTETGMSDYTWSFTGLGYMYTLNADGSLGQNIASGSSSSAPRIRMFWHATETGNRTISVNYRTPDDRCWAPAPAVKTITIHPPAVPTITGDSIVCYNVPGYRYSTEPGMSSYEWSVPGWGATVTAGGGTQDDFIEVTFKSPGTQNVRVSYNDSHGCRATQYKAVTVDLAATPVITGNTSLCYGENSNSVVYSTAEGMSNYVWNVPSGASVVSGGTTTDHTVTVNWNVTGTHTLSVNYVQANGCVVQGPGTQSVTITPRPGQPTISANKNCLSEGNIYSTQIGMKEYVWSIPPGEGVITAGGGPADHSVTVTWLTPGFKTIRVNYRTASNCSPVNEGVLNVNITPVPVPIITLPASKACISINNHAAYRPHTFGGTYYYWTATNATVIGPNSPNPYIHFTTAGQQVISVSYLYGNGCQTSQVQEIVTVNPLPEPAIVSGSSAQCAGSSSIYTADAGWASYQWFTSFNHSGVANGPEYTVTWGSYTNSPVVQLIVTDANGCKNYTPASKSVYVENPTLSAPASVCQHTDVTFTTEAGKSNYVWTYPGATWVSGGGSSDNTLTVRYATDGTYNVHVVYGSLCPNGVTRSVVVKKAPTVFLSPGTPQKICPDGERWFTASSAQGESNTYQWFRDGVLFSPNITSTRHAASAAGNYTVVAKNSLNCTTTSSAVPLAIVPYPSATTIPAAPFTMCRNNGMQLTANSGSDLTYRWTNAAGSFVSNAIAFSPAATDSYKVTVTQAGICSTTSAPVTVTVRDTPRAVAIVNGSSGTCTTSSVHLYNIDNEPGYTFLWYQDNHPIFEATERSYYAKETGSYKVRVRDGNNCESTSEPVSVTAGSLQIVGPSAFCPGGSATLVASVNGTAVSYLWSTGETNSSITVTSPGTYSLTIVDASGCTRTNSKTVNMQSVLNGGTISAWPGTCIMYAGMSISLSAPAGGTNYIWSTGQTGESISVTDMGNYAVSYMTGTTPRRGCIDITGCFVRTRGTEETQSESQDGSEQSSFSAAFNYYPNPADRILHIDIPETSHRQLQIKVVNVAGSVVLHETFKNDGGVHDIDVSGLPPGIYFIVVQSHNLIVHKGRVMIARQLHQTYSDE